MKTHGTAVWQGGIKDGKGTISTKSGALKDYPYGFSSRFEGKPGTNPEEQVTLEKVADGFAITAVHLTLKAKVPGADQAKFDELAAKAKAGCPVSKLLNAKITLDATLVY